MIMKIEKKNQINLGVSTNHKVVKSHGGIRFQTRSLTIDEIVDLINDNCFFCSPISLNSEYSVQKANKFCGTSLIPFDLDNTKDKMEDFLAKLPDELQPTIAFQTRHNNDEIGPFKFRLFYIFDAPFPTREDYYSAHEAIKDEIIKYTKDFGDDEFSYGLNPEGCTKSGNCCKPIRTNASGNIVCTYNIFSKDDFYIPIIFSDLDYNYDDGLNRDLFSSKLLDLIFKYHKYDTLYANFKFRDFSYTRSQFQNGFSYMRGNLNYAEFIRKFVVAYTDEGERKYSVAKWGVGEKRHKKLRMDAMIARFNDYSDNGKCTITGDELFMILYDESRRYFVVRDNENNDGITCIFLLTIASEIIQMEVEAVISEVRKYLQKTDQRGGRSLIRIDRRYWSSMCGYNDFNKNEIRKIVRHIARFLKLFSAYDTSLSISGNSEKMMKMRKTDSSFPGCSISCLNHFVADCRLVHDHINGKSTSTDNDIFSELKGPMQVNGDMISFEHRLAELHLKSELDICKLNDIISNTNIVWKKVKKGVIPMVKNGRPHSQWQDELSVDDAKMRLKDLIKKVNDKHPEVPNSSIKTWKYRMMKR